MKIFNAIKVLIQNLLNVKGWIKTISDYLNNFIGLGVDNSDTFSLIHKDNNLTDNMTSLFENCKVSVYIYESKIPDAYTIPTDAPIFTNPIIWKIMHIINIITLNMAVNIYLLLITLGVLNKEIATSIKSKKIKYNPTTKKISLPINYATIYISSALIDLLNNNEDEIKATLLHEVGHNLQMIDWLTARFVESTVGIFEKISIISLLVSSINYILGIEEVNKELLIPKMTGITKLPEDHHTFDQRLNNTIDSFYKLGSTLLIFCAVGIITSYFHRKMEIEADEFAIKAGYGKELYSAIRKLNDYALARDFGKSLGKIKGYNPVDFFIYLIGLAGRWVIQVAAIFKVFNYPDPWTRERYIKEKTEAYDISDKHIDRTENIDKSWFK